MEKFKSQTKNTDIDQLTDFVRYSSSGEKRLILFFLKSSKKYNQMYFTQSFIAKIALLHRVSVNRAIKRLVEYGFITKVYRHMKSCVYQLTDMVINPPRAIKALLEMICFFSISQLLPSPSMPPFRGHATQDIYYRNYSNLKSNNYIYKYTSNINGRSAIPQKKEDFIHPMTEKLKNFNLTVDQKLKISVFHEDALKYALNQLTSKPKVWPGLKFYLEEYCRLYGIKPNLRQYYVGREIWKDELMKVEEPQKEVSEILSIGSTRTRAYIKPKCTKDYMALLNTNPLEVFSRQYTQFLKMENHFLSEHVRWTMGVSNIVKTSFYSFLGSQNISTIKILYHIESLMELGEFLEILNQWGPAGAQKFLALCFESALDAQQDALRHTASLQKYRDEEKIKCQVIEMGIELQEFMRSDCYIMMKDILGEEVLRNNIYTLINNWIKLAT